MMIQFVTKDPAINSVQDLLHELNADEIPAGPPPEAALLLGHCDASMNEVFTHHRLFISMPRRGSYFCFNNKQFTQSCSPALLSSVHTAQ